MKRLTVETVLGTIDASSLGKVHSHEHLYADAVPDLVEKDQDLALNWTAPVIRDVLEFKQAGGGAIVEMTTVDYGRNPLALRNISEETGVHVIAATGFNKGRYCRPFVETKDVNAIVDWMISEITEGMEGTTIKAGVIKFGTSLNAIEPWERTAAIAAARAHLLTGTPIITHTEKGTMAEEQLALLAEEGVPQEHVILCHLDRNPDLSLHSKLAGSGAFLSYDQIPKPKYQTENFAIEAILHLSKQGLHTQILLGGDFSRRSYFIGWGGKPGLRYLLTDFSMKLSSALEEEGFDSKKILDDLFINNPKHAFSKKNRI